MHILSQASSQIPTGLAVTAFDESLVLFQLATAVCVQVLLAEIAGQNLAVAAFLKGALRIERHSRMQLLASISRSRLTRINVVAEAVVNTSQQRRQGQIGIGVGAGDTVFDTARAARTFRNANSHRTVFIAPTRAHRHITVGDESPIGIDVGGKYRHRFGQGLPEPADGVPELRAGGCAVRILLAAAIEYVFSIVVEQTDVQVQSATGARHIRLGHEGALQSVFSGHALNRTAEHHALIGRFKWLVAVAQVDFELAGGVFRRDRADCYALPGAGVIHLVQIVAEIFNLIDTIDLGGVASLPAERRQRRLDALAVVVRRVEQIELQFKRHHRPESQFTEALDNSGQDVSGFKIIGFRIQALQGQHHLRGGITRPRSRHQSAVDGNGDFVRVAVGKPQALWIMRIAGDGQQNRRAGQHHAVGENFVGQVNRVTLTTNHARQVA